MQARAGRQLVRALMAFGWAAAALGAVLAPRAQAQERWAAISLIGDRMHVGHAASETGTHLNSVSVDRSAMPDDQLDRLAMRSVLNANVRGLPDVVPLALRDPRLYEAQGDLLLAQSSALLEPVRKAIASLNVTHILLVTRARGDATFTLADGAAGRGRIEGLGFYVDRNTRLKVRETGESGAGYLAPYAYYKLQLFDLVRNVVVAEEQVTASTLYTVAGSQESDPWELVSARRKLDDLEKLLDENTAQALRRLLEKPRK